VPKLNNKRLQLLVVPAILILVIVLAVVFGSSAKPAKTVQSCGKYRNDKTVIIGHNVFKAEAPESQAEFDKGLGGRPCILSDEAMIFPFTRPGQYAFWMKDMKFPIDILWISANHIVVAEKINLQPSTYPKKYANPASLPAEYVLEIKANLTKQLNIKPGTIVQF
jgi:uncharacterized membrane protein (UPF0127 family)